MDRKTAVFARSWAKRYVREKHPYGLDEEDVENRILESLYKYSRGKFPDAKERDALCPVLGRDKIRLCRRHQVA